MHSVMNQERLSERLTLACERDLTDKIDLDRIADRMVSRPFINIT